MTTQVIEFTSDTDWMNFLNKEKDDFVERMSRKEPKNYKVEPSEFKYTKTLGIGSFGLVMLAERDGQRYAAKLVHKEDIVQRKLVNNIKNEKNFLESFNLRFLVNIEFFFQDNVYLYLIMPFLEGGDILSMLHKSGKFDEELSKFYSAQVLLALEYMHYLDLVYRDLKPENILLDREGYVRIGDYGYVKEVKDRTFTFCGTPEYIAPEIIRAKGYGKSVDYWAFGILLYEFNSGRTPFFALDEITIYEKIIEGKYRFKAYFSMELRDLLKQLLQYDWNKRYGSLMNGINDIKEHQWYAEVQWIALLNKSITAPYIPSEDALLSPYEEKQLETRPDDPYKDEFADI